MPSGASWAGARSTTLGPLEIQVSGDPALAAEAPFIGNATLRDEWSGDQSVMSGVVVLVMNPDGRGFVASWGRFRAPTERLLGSR